MSTKKIRIALAGLGFGAEFIPIYLAHPNAEVVALCQRNPAKLKEIGDRYKISKRYTDFDALLKPEKMKKDEDKFADVLSESKQDLAMNKKMEDDAIEAVRQARIRLLQSGNAERFRLETVSSLVDDNPKFETTLRMATPAPPSHFLRVFGQPARDNLGGFRDWVAGGGEVEK